MNIRYSMRPRCNPENYYLLLKEPIFDENNEAIVGNFYNADGSINVELYLSDYLISQSQHRFMYLECVHKYYLTQSYIVISQAFYDELKVNDYLFALVWHEIGHFHSVPFILDENKGAIPEQRKNAVLNGEVMIEEKIADLFAVYSCGKDNMIRALKWAREGRKKANYINTEYAIREYNNRIRFIKEINESVALELFNKLIDENRICD